MTNKARLEVRANAKVQDSFMNRSLNLHEDTFCAHFEPYRHPKSRFNIWNGLGLETYGEDLAVVRSMDVNYVWTVVDRGDGPDQCISPGFAFVKRLCYLVTRKPHYCVNVHFRVPHSLSSLTPIGLRRQTTQLTRLIEAKVTQQTR